MSRHPVSRRATRRPPRRRLPWHPRRKEPPKRVLPSPTPQYELALRKRLLQALQTQSGEAARRTRRQLRRYWTFEDSCYALGTPYRMDVPDHVRRGEPNPNRKSKRPPRPARPSIPERPA